MDFQSEEGPMSRLEESGSGMRFRLIDNYLGERLGASVGTVSPGNSTVVESPLRLRAESSYGYVHALWWVWLSDGRSIISMPPGTGTAVSGVVAGIHSADEMTCPEVQIQLRSIVDGSLERAGLRRTDRVLQSLLFVCNHLTLRPRPLGSCRRLRDDSVPASSGLRLPTHCLPDGTGKQHGGQKCVRFKRRASMWI